MEFLLPKYSRGQDPIPSQMLMTNQAEQKAIQVSLKILSDQMRRYNKFYLNHSRSKSRFSKGLQTSNDAERNSSCISEINKGGNDHTGLARLPVPF